ncbi:Caleosin related protein-domain-containing protein [Podospora didyma]|uniref:Caleosin related protein-domain-containing protein n=1 Tax=Podospora didyma TaxID=330526 RepID=A0AAE0N260_9PEZI|nr:Caleosin related protein-domain-containing protein [Podospora didyma]
MSHRSGASSPTATGDINFDVAASQCPVSTTRKQAVDIDAFIDRPSVARANVAPSTQNPHGSVDFYPSEKMSYTVLQQHVRFWDRDDDGAIYPWDTYRGFRELGFNMIFSLLSVFIIHSGLSYPTRLAFSLFPDPWFRVYVRSIHKAKHGSDSGTYDTEGRFVPQKFEDMFSKWDNQQRGSLSAGQLLNMIKGHRLAVDPFGWFAALFEFGSTWLLVQQDGRVSKEDLRQVYDGSLFWRIRQTKMDGKPWTKGFGVMDLGKLAVRQADRLQVMLLRFRHEFNQKFRADPRVMRTWPSAKVKK